MILSNLSDRGTLRGSLMYSVEDYNILANKPQINSNELVGNKTGHQLGLANLDDIIYVEANPAGTPSGDLTKLQVGDVIYNIAGQIVYGDASGTIASFDDGGNNKPLKSLKVAINPVQSGSGEPSPSNVRPISGWDEAEIHRADGATPHIIDDTYNITWSEAGEVFGGTITVYPDGSGEMDITNASIDDMSSLNWVYDTSGTPYFYAPITGKKVGNNILCEIFKLDTRLAVDMDNNSIKGHGSNNTIVVKATDYTSITAFENLVEDKKVTYELATPRHIDFPAGTFPTFTTLLGNNNLWSNTGKITECVYQRDLNIVINKLLQQ